jgi:hypothetical protein
VPPEPGRRCVPRDGNRSGLARCSRANPAARCYPAHGRIGMTHCCRRLDRELSAVARSKAFVRVEAERWLLTPGRIRHESRHRIPASATDTAAPIRQDRGRFGRGPGRPDWQLHRLRAVRAITAKGGPDGACERRRVGVPGGVSR